MRTQWTIGELARVVEKALELAEYQGQDSARVRSVPDQRTIRYYTTLGLLDKPVEMQGRTAFYGRRHVLQLVVIKQLQSQGLALADIQQELAGAGDAALMRKAGLSGGVWERVAEAAEPGDRRKEKTKPRDSRFWAAPPEDKAEGKAAKGNGGRLEARPALEVSIAKNVRLVIEGVEPDRVNREKLEELLPAVELLRDALRDAGLS